MFCFSCVLFFTVLYFYSPDLEATKTSSTTNTVMLPTILFPLWLAQLWRAIPLNFQLPIAGLVYILVLVGVRTMDSWVRSLRKDPIALISHGFAILFGIVIAAQLLYFGITWLLAPLSTFAKSYQDACAVATTYTLPPMPFPKTYLTILLLVAIGMWRLGQLHI